MKKFIDSFGHAVDGIVYSIKSQRNMKIHMAAAFLALMGSLFLDMTRVELMMLFITIAFVFVCEMFNTAIEKAIDITTREFNPLAKISKDVAAGAVLISAFNALIIGYLLFINEVNPTAKRVIDRIIASPFHISVICIAFVTLLVLFIKYRLHSKNLLRGGMPSGHSAAAFSIVTIIWYLTDNMFVKVLVFALGTLVAQSRVEGKIHSILEAIVGAVFGVLVTGIIMNLII